MSSRQTGVGLTDNLAQAVAVGQRKIEELYQAGQFGRHFDRGSGEHQGPAVGGEFLAHVAQAAHHYRVIHVAMEILEHEYSFDGHGLQVGQRLHRIGGVVHGGPRTGAGVVANRRQHRSHQSIGFAVALRDCAHSSFRTRISNRWGSGDAAARADEAVGDGPFEDR